ncbi:hypothetical protein KQR57_18035 [Bacillus inaquosorum]|nr:hypothetical protein [Bacillus inaquosorum]
MDKSAPRHSKHIPAIRTMTAPNDLDVHWISSDVVCIFSFDSTAVLPFINDNDYQLLFQYITFSADLIERFK